MRILVLSDSYETDGGATQIAKIMAQELKNRRQDVLVIASTKDRMSAGFKTVYGVGIYKIYTDYNLFWRSYVGLYNPQVTKPLKKIIYDFKPDVVQAHNIHSYISYHALKIAKKSGAKVFLTAHDVQLFHYGKLIEIANKNDLSCPEKFNYKISVWQQIKRAGKTYNPLRNIIIRHYLKYVDKIIAVSEALKEALNQNGITNVVVVRNGIDFNVWRADVSSVEEFKKKFGLNGKKTILFGGRLSETKGGKEIVLAMEKIVKNIPDARLVVLGNIDDYTKQLVNMAAKLRIQDNLVFTGWLNGNSLKSAFNACDMAAVPSVCFDSFPTVNLEAMACKKPVIATCFGGSREAVLDGKTGYIVNPFNIKELADKIIDLLKNPEKMRQFGETGYERVKQNFSADKMVGGYLEWYSRGDGFITDLNK